MPELRQNRFTKEWVIMATERAKRPEDLRRTKAARPVAPKHSPTCPFCLGNENMTPPPVLVSPSVGPWQVRVIPNRYPALARDALPARRIERSWRSLNGVGIHDVIVEAPEHDATTALLPREHVADILRCYKRRFEVVSADSRIAHVTIFKNHGESAGTSLEHPHSQLIGTPVISSQVRNRLYEALRHFDEFGECIFCTVLNDELDEQKRIVAVTKHFVALEPYASSTPFATYIYPRRHMASFGDITEVEIFDLAALLKAVLAKLYYGLEDPDYNFTIRTAPTDCAGVTYYHWYMSIIPRLVRVAGFELGTGMFINTVLPEDAAEFFRSIDIEIDVPAVV